MAGGFWKEVTRRRAQSLPPKCPRCNERNKVVPVVYGSPPPEWWGRTTYRLGARFGWFKPTDKPVTQHAATHWCKRCNASFQDTPSAKAGKFSVTKGTAPIVQEPGYRLPPNVKVKKQ